MARKPALSEEKRAETAAVIERLQDVLGSHGATSRELRARYGREVTPAQLGAVARGARASAELAADVAKLAAEVGAESPRVERTVVPDERYPAVAQVFARARAAGASEELLAAVRLRLGVYRSETGPTEQEVADALVDESRQIRALEARLGEEDPALDVAPRVPTRSKP